MKNVTITLDEKVATWAREHAARQNKSLSRYVGEMLETTMRESREYDRAMRRYLDRKPIELNRGRAPYPSRDDPSRDDPSRDDPSRDDLHDRGHLR